MKFMIHIPVDLEIADTRRATIKSAGNRFLIELARDPEKAAKWLRDAVNTGEAKTRAVESAPATE